MSGKAVLSAQVNNDSTVGCIFLSMLARRRRKRKDQRRQRGGSRSGKRPNVERDFQGRFVRFYQLYFARVPIYNAEQFRRRFRMRRELFLKICKDVTAFDSFFIQKKNCAGKAGIHPLMKITAALRCLAYGCSSDSLDENLEISESVVNESLVRFVNAAIYLYRDEYLRLLTKEDIQQLLVQNAQRGFPGMLGSIDCMKWKWKNCPTAWRAAFESGRERKPTVVMEAVASFNLWIWHCFVGMPGSHNDINVLDASPLISEYLDKDHPQFAYSVNGNEYNFMYWLADGIYPDWRCFVKTITAPSGPAQEAFAAAQEAVRKDVERAFGVLQARFAILTRPGRSWSISKVSAVMKACVILHNMIVADDEKTGRIVSTSRFDYAAREERAEDYTFTFTRNLQDNCAPFTQKMKKVMRSADHFKLKADLVQHLHRKQQRRQRE